MSEVQEYEAKQEEKVPVVNMVQVPRETLAEIRSQLEFEIAKYGHSFRTREDAEYFAMLPLQAEQKQCVLKRARDFEREARGLLVRPE